MYIMYDQKWCYLVLNAAYLIAFNKDLLNGTIALTYWWVKDKL